MMFARSRHLSSWWKGICKKKKKKRCSWDENQRQVERIIFFFSLKTQVMLWSLLLVCFDWWFFSSSLLTCIKICITLCLFVLSKETAGKFWQSFFSSLYFGWFRFLKAFFLRQLIQLFSEVWYHLCTMQLWKCSSVLPFEFGRKSIP